MTVTAFGNILNYLDARNLGDLDFAVTDNKKTNDSKLSFDSEKGIGIVPVTGALTYVDANAICGDGGTSYKSILRNTQELLNLGAKTIVLDMNSGGGQAYQCFETATALREMVDNAGAKLISYVDGNCASACYGIAATSHEIIINPKAKAGSIGVVMELRNNSEQLKQDGITRTFVYAGKNKIPFAEDGSFRQDFLDELQSQVEEAYADFITHVATYRNLSPQEVEATDAKMFSAAKAIKLGLVDKKMTLNEFKAYLGYVADKPLKVGGKMPLDNLIKAEVEEMSDKDLTQLEAAVATLTAEKADMAQLLASKEEQLSSFQAVLAEKESVLLSLNEKLQTVEAQASLLNTEIEQLKQAQADAKAKTRFDRIKACVAEDKVEGICKATMSLDDAAFDLVVGAYESREQALAASFQEVGGQGDVSAITKQKSADEIAFEKFLSESK